MQPVRISIDTVGVPKELDEPGDLRPIVDDASMHEVTSPESSGALKIQSAEEWRQLGERLRKADPETYERVFALLVLSIPESSGDDGDSITKSYLLT